MNNRVIRCVVPVLSAVLVASVAMAQGTGFGASSSSEVSGSSSFQRVLSGSGISPTKAAMAFYARVVRADAEALRALRTIAKLNQDAVTAYVEYAKAAIAENKDFARDERARLLCKKREEIRTGDQLTAALVEIDTNIESKKGQSIAGSESFLGADGKRMLDDYILGTRSMMTIRENDPTKIVKFGADQGQSIADMVAGMCVSQ
jgi:hypothetical protein